jgi:predicted PurR-regulated permease PerM
LTKQCDIDRQQGAQVTTSTNTRIQARNDLAWAISVGGIGAVLFAALLVATWYFASTLFLIFAGALLGVALYAMSNLLGRVTEIPHPLRLAAICLLLLALLSGVIFLGGATIAQQATALSGTIKSQVVNLKAFLEKYGVDTSYLDLGNLTAAAAPSGAQNEQKDDAPTPDKPHNLPSAGTIASSGGAILTQTWKIVLGTVGAVGNFFIVVFLGLCFAAQPGVYRRGLIALAPRKHRRDVAEVVDRIGDTLERWLVAQMITMFAVFLVTWIGLMLLGIPSAFILGVQAGLLTFIPTVGALIGGLIVVLASLASGPFAALSAFVLFLGVHALESYILTPLLQRQALEIPPATLFAFQILLGVVFGVWGLALALPLVAVVKVVMEFVREDEGAAA